MSVIEFYDRPGKPLYHLENFIEGNYIKYNSNSGFVDESSRFTPQAFSHFTFERSGHNMIVVDVQGVGDLWTDPQVRKVLFGNVLILRDMDLNSSNMVPTTHGKHREFGNSAKTQGIWFAQFVNSLVLNEKRYFDICCKNFFLFF